MCCMRLAGNTGRKKSPSEHHRTSLSGCISATKARIVNRKKNLLNSNNQCPPHAAQYGELRLTSGWDLLESLGHPCRFQRVSRLGSVTARHSSSGREPNFAALNRGRHLYSAGRPSCWALAHILVLLFFEYYLLTKTSPAEHWHVQRSDCVLTIALSDGIVQHLAVAMCNSCTF